MMRRLNLFIGKYVARNPKYKNLWRETFDFSKRFPLYLRYSLALGFFAMVMMVLLEGITIPVLSTALFFVMMYAFFALKKEIAYGKRQKKSFKQLKEAQPRILIVTADRKKQSEK